MPFFATSSGQVRLPKGWLARPSENEFIPFDSDQFGGLRAAKSARKHREADENTRLPVDEFHPGIVHNAAALGQKHRLHDGTRNNGVRKRPQLDQKRVDDAPPARSHQYAEYRNRRRENKGIEKIDACSRVGKVNVGERYLVFE